MIKSPTKQQKEKYENAWRHIREILVKEDFTNVDVLSLLGSCFVNHLSMMRPLEEGYLEIERLKEHLAHQHIVMANKNAIHE